jgi:putative membrane protein
MRQILVLAAVMLAAPAAGMAQAVPPAVPGPAAATGQSIAQDYVAAAAAGDLFERIASELVLRNEGGSPGVQQFAQKMIEDHHNMTVMLRRVAESVGVRPAVPMLTPLQQARIEQLQAVTGAQRERVYMIQQMEAHQEALALHQSYALGGDLQPLREQARMAAQIVEGHLMELPRLQGGG